MKTLIHTHSWEERAQRRPRTKNKRNAISLDTTYSCTRCALNKSKKFHFHRSHDVTETPRDMQTCRPTPRPLGPSAQGKELINKGELNFKTVRKWLHCLLTLLGERVKGRQEKSRKERWCQLTVPYLHDYALWEGHQGAQATSWFFPGSKHSGKIKFWACSGAEDYLVIYSLICSNTLL